MMAEEKKAQKSGESMKTLGSGLISNHSGNSSLSTPSPRRSSIKLEDTASTTSTKRKKTNCSTSSDASHTSRPSSSKNTRKNELISENCKKFNRLFHCSSGSEDSTSSSDTVLEVTKDKVPVTLSSSGTGNTDNSSKLVINPSTQYFHHDAVHSPFQPATLSSDLPKVSAKHGTSKLLSIPKVIPIKIKSEIKQEKEEEYEQPEVRVKTETNETTQNQYNIKKEDNSWCDVELEIEVQVDTNTVVKNDSPSSIATAKTAENTDDSRCRENCDHMDADKNGTTEQEGKRAVKRIDRESKKLMMQLTDNEKRKSSRLVSKATFCNKKHEAQIMKRLKQIIKKSTDDLTAEERQLKEAFPQLVRVAKKRLETRKLASERLKEIEDSPEDLEIKCTKLAKVIKNAKYLVVYTGAGISTSASIPDYRGPNGIWTKLRNGESLDAQSPTVLTTADPTLTHMAIKKLHSERIIKHIVSQNCDGLHLRSGIPKNALSEVHGNMYIEVCIKCSLEYVRNFDVTENTRRYEHRTGRHCYFCGSQLKDTVVHFGERGSLRWPLNWAGAEYNVARADVILCMGSSLKVLRRYPWLWGMDLPFNKRPKLYIVNLQWTPKDQFAALKIHGKCDEVMSKVMSKLNVLIPSYERETDQIFALATPLHESEAQSKSAVELTFPPDKPWPTNPPDLNNYTRFEPRFIPPDLKVKKEEDEMTQAEIAKLSKSGSRVLRSQLKAKLGDNKKDMKKSPLKKKRDRSTIIKGNGNGWFGNAWGKSAVKAKKRKTSTSTTVMTKPTENVSPPPVQQEPKVEV